jgi:phosphatidylglycerophosphatase C
VKKKLVLFDFDGTITTKDTLLEFIRFYHGTGRFVSGFLLHAPWLLMMKLNIIPNWKTKEKILTWFFGGEDAEHFNARCKEFCDSIVPGLVRKKALEEIKRHQEEGATVVVISASAENWVRPWCEQHQLNCLATKLEATGKTLTGRIEGFNCYGSEKEKRIRSCYNLNDYNEIVAYGDSRGDLEMLALAQQQHYKPFRT